MVVVLILVSISDFVLNIFLVFVLLEAMGTTSQEYDQPGVPEGRRKKKKKKKKKKKQQRMIIRRGRRSRGRRRGRGRERGRGI